MIRIRPQVLAEMVTLLLDTQEGFHILAAVAPDLTAHELQGVCRGTHEFREHSAGVFYVVERQLARELESEP